MKGRTRKKKKERQKEKKERKKEGKKQRKKITDSIITLQMKTQRTKIRNWNAR